MPEGNAEMIGSIYGFNWAAVDERERGLSVSQNVVAPDVEARISPEVGERTLHGLQGFAVFVLGLEQDFSEFRYDADRIVETAPDQVVVLGNIRARGRTSKMPLTAPFQHNWTLKDGRAVRVEAHLRSHAEAAASTGSAVV